MNGEIILLTSDLEASHLASILHKHNPELSIIAVQKRAELEKVVLAGSHANNWRRMIAFCSSVIVPTAVLNHLGGPAYNFHPGPPNYPGAHPASFAIYHQVDQYGVTVHEITSTIDSGTIVATEWFKVRDKIRFSELEMDAYKVLLSVFQRMSERLAKNPTPLLPSGETWSGKTNTREDFNRMREVTAEMDEGEITLRFRAFG
ncbi:MAG: hypothetical protein CBB68_14180 [Rhodospirillaceae bacterium TMED8]|nr:methionyl-tRNA formyltransferase [Magnetovibrio sp.]OUT48108.1 MAG: hypothetical protein CBB68_14180 [Rhodospirillaceae bacterium TMED8]|tara:strand:+ start:1206 stop:1814 length:609 start_codon:yes stop_codon:yes gene_type:complete